MRNLIRAELLKIRTVRTVYGSFAAMLVLVAVAVVNTTPLDIRTPLPEQEFVFAAASITWLFVLIVGIRSFTDEFRHGTIVSTLLTTPNRVRVLVAKVSVRAVIGLVFAVSALTLTFAIGVPRLTSDGSVPTLETASLLGRFGLVSVLWATLGLAIGSIVRHQVAAIVGSIVWIVFVETLLESHAVHVAKFLPVHATTALMGPPNVDDVVLTGLEGGMMLVAWAVAGCALAAVVLRRRDIA